MLHTGSLFYHSVALQKVQSCLIAFLRLLLVRFVEMPLVALPTCGCQCHKCPYQRGRVILPGTSHSVRTLVCPGFAAAQENKISHSRLTVDIIYTRWKLTLFCYILVVQPMEVFVDDETKLTLHGLQQYYCKLKDSEKNRKLFDLLDVLEFNQVGCCCLGKVHKT